MMTAAYVLEGRHCLPQPFCSGLLHRIRVKGAASDTNTVGQAPVTGQPSALATAQRAASALSQVCLLTPSVHR